jgi:hypothetical protein
MHTQLDITDVLLKADRALHKLGTVGRETFFGEGTTTIERDRDIMFIAKACVENFRYTDFGSESLESVINLLVSKYTVYSYGNLSPIYSNVSTQSGVFISVPSHTHPISDIENLQDELDNKSDISHTHTFAEITDKPTTVAGYGITDVPTLAVFSVFGRDGDVAAEVSDYDSFYSQLGHTHDIADITNLSSSLTLINGRIDINETDIDNLTTTLSDHTATFVNSQSIQDGRLDDIESINASQSSDITILQGLSPTADQKDALDASNNPSTFNRYLTESDIIGGLPTGQIPTAYVAKTTQETITSGTFVNVAGTTASVTISSSVPVYSICSFETSQSGGGSQVVAEMRLMVDGVASEPILVDYANGVNGTGSINFRTNARPTGLKMVTLQARKVSGAKDFHIDKAFIFVEGLQAPKGIDGIGIPSGGVTNSVLKKIDGTDYNTVWSFVDWSELSGIPSTFAPSAHTHTEVDILDLDKYTQAQVDSLLSTKSDVGHTHTFASITSKPTTLGGYGITDAIGQSQVGEGLEFASGVIRLGGNISGGRTFWNVTSNNNNIDINGGNLNYNIHATGLVGFKSNTAGGGAINFTGTGGIVRITSAAQTAFPTESSMLFNVGTQGDVTGNPSALFTTASYNNRASWGIHNNQGGSPFYYWTTANNTIGIGRTSTPQGRLHVWGGGTSSSTITQVWSNSSNAELARINDAGNLLIGTTTDNGAKLQVNGTSTFSDVMTIGRLASDGANLNGNIMYNSTTNKFRAYENGAWKDMIGGGGTWGSITGTLSNQTDLQSALDGKSSTSHTHTFSELTSKPTTLSGFGITDAIGGTIANTQIAFGTGTGTIGGSSNLTWGGTQLAINGGANNFILRLTSTSVGSYTRYTTSVTDVSVGSSSAGLLDVFDNTSGIRRLIVTTGGMTATTNTASNFITQISSVRNIVSGLDGAGDFALYDNTLSRHYISFVSNNLRLLQAGVGNVLIGTTTDNGAKLQVAGTSTFSGVMTIGRLASDGANLNGNIMYNSTTNKFRAYENGQWVNMIGGGGGGAVDSVFGRTGNVSALVGDYSAFYSQLGHTHTFASLTSIPTTIGGYGITDTTSVLITGFVSGAGIVAATDTILQAIQKLNGNDSLNVKIASNLSDLNNVVTARNNILPSKSGNSLKVLRVNAGETDYELATISGGGGTWGTISGTLSAQTDLQSALDGKENTFSKNTAFNKNFGVIADTVAEGNDSRFHTHTNTTDLARVGVLVNLTDSPTITLDSAAGEVFVVTLGGNRNLAAPSNPVSGRKIIVRFRQDGTGNRTISFNAAYRFSTDVPSPTLTTGANKTDYLGFIYNGIDAVWDCVAVTKGF